VWEAAVSGSSTADTGELNVDVVTIKSFVQSNLESSKGLSPAHGGKK
jgi:hypothetical protein